MRHILFSGYRVARADLKRCSNLVELIYAGSETRAVVETQSRLQVTARSVGSAELVPGQPISIRWMTDKGVLLP
ncbi:TOBE domain-containing protein [Pseudomonas syringae]|uniref:TOBE domain-containing protein n=1 Tax=Pseudomonas syringae pv. papulans TaxID=83963 RepID=A0A0P9ZVL5_PSESX|nr:Unknown protein sequence [Pseudomonas syringae pv. papulans]POP83759.1 TOBE domain-containing protein [Pseudomonas syringae]KWS38882.1 hypothetical protein AL059_26275 [Pseudomonas syringae pv. papulans]MDH4606851.1 TOBE domain-containing protein [Pseudomonas syringae pv. papulans]MDH4623165.1 TOBE domain-containing protein [Pseudomonas syringae pv. papulans]